jgi:hypothetical protein
VSKHRVAALIKACSQARGVDVVERRNARASAVRSREQLHVKLFGGIKIACDDS